MSPTILVVDDDPQLRAALVIALSDAGYTVDEATDGINALRRLAEQTPDVILSDVRMPHLDGIGSANVLGPHSPRIPFIVMSADPLPAGCSLPYLRKPFDLDEALTLMARTLSTDVASVALSGLGVI